MRRIHVTHRLLTVIGTAALLMAAIGCGDDDTASTSGVDEVTVEALDNVFGDEPHQERIEPGGTVTWENVGRNDHNVISVDGAPFGVGEAEFGPGDEYSATFDEPGVYAYYCSLHGTTTDGMIGTVLVGDVEAPPAPEPDPDALDIVASGTTIEVPGDHDTIQGAVDAAEVGDLILVSPGTYTEGVVVPAEKDGITIRGLDRDEVILDGEFSRANGVQVVGADGVVVENMTARNYTQNGFFWTGVTGYRGSYLTAVRNGDYGVYAFDSTRGQIDHSYASGSPDAGFYIGGCYPCDAVIHDVISEWNGLGYSGTNAGGNLVIAESVFRHNRAGIVPNSGSYEPDYPQRENVIVGNLVHDNSNGDTPAIDIAITAMGNGILVAGGVDNVIERNRVLTHDLGGIVVISYPESDEYFWDATGNQVRDNVVADSGLGDLALWTGADDDAGENCFEDNDAGTTAPLDLETVAACPGGEPTDLTDGAFDVVRLAVNDGKPDSVPYEDVELPDIAAEERPQMPDPATSPARPAVDVPSAFDVDAVEVPPAP